MRIRYVICVLLDTYQSGEGYGAGRRRSAFATRRRRASTRPGATTTCGTSRNLLKEVNALAKEALAQLKISAEAVHVKPLVSSARKPAYSTGSSINASVLRRGNARNGAMTWVSAAG